MATLEELRAQHPEWNVTQVIDAPGGGQYAVGADGGVFALGGAPFMGSYQGLAPEQRQGTRGFTGIRLNDQGGYTLISDQPGQEYAFGPQGQPLPGPAPGPPPAPPSPAAPSPAPPPPPAAPGAEEVSAKAALRGFLRDYGLPESLADGLWQDSITLPPEEIAQKVRATPQYKTRYPGMDALRAKGRAISEDEYRSTEKTIKETMSFYGLPQHFYDSPDDFGRFIAGEVSPKELDDRIRMAATAAYTAPPEFRRQLEAYGLSAGDLTAYFLDPPAGEEAIKRKVLFSQAEIGVGSQRSGFGMLTRDEAERFRQAGMTGEQAGQALGQVTQFQGLTAGTAEEERTGGALGREALVGSAVGNEAETARIRRAQERRKARFEGGGGAYTRGEGATGLGSD